MEDFVSSKDSTKDSGWRVGITEAVQIAQRTDFCPFLGFILSLHLSLLSLPSLEQQKILPLPNV